MTGDPLHLMEVAPIVTGVKQESNMEWWKILVAVGVAFGIAQTQIVRNSQEIDRLRTNNESRSQLDLVMARTVATKDDIEALRKEVASLGASMDAKFDRMRSVGR